ncbi:MAG: hypothetical protein HY649_09885 [Acidobacteria bacterium]|nr:hypothetical protein [Acidobacteriota bacterium]
MGKSTILRNFGALVSSDLEKPRLDADAIAKHSVTNICEWRVILAFIYAAFSRAYAQVFMTLCLAATYQEFRW